MVCLDKFFKFFLHNPHGSPFSAVDYTQEPSELMALQTANSQNTIIRQH